MKKLLLLLIGIVVIAVGVTTVITACGTPPVEKRIYITVTDSTAIDSLVYYREQLIRTQDSLNAAKDSLGENLFIAKYKLARIKYYNDIAAKGNNIKYLRGWINRVLND